MPKREGTTDLINRYSAVYLDKINLLVVYRKEGDIIFEGPISKSQKAIDTVNDYYITDKDELTTAYKSTISDIQMLVEKYGQPEEK